MKKMIIVLSVFLAVSAVASAQATKKATEKETQKTMYACPMHPKEMSDKKGTCGKCGMDMVKVTETTHNTAIKGSQSSSYTKYVCKMDSQTSDKPGNCPKCGMKMTKVEDKK